MGTYLRIIGTLAVVLALVLGISTRGRAQEAPTVTWTVAASDDYTVTDNGAEPLVEFNDCLETNSTYTVEFSVNVDATDFDATFAATGETLQFLQVSFDPAGVAGSGATTVEATATLTTQDTTFEEPTGQERERFGIYLEPQGGGAPLGDSFLAVDIPCIVAAGGGDDQQDGDTGGGDDQQGGTVMKTFKLTLNGDVPEGQSFYAQYLVQGAGEDMTQNILFCGELIEEEPKAACEGNGTVYSVDVEFEQGTVLDFRFGRHNLDYSDIEVFFRDSETLNSDMVNSAYYTFGATDDQKDDDQGSGAGDDQQDDEQDSGAGDDQQDGGEVPRGLPKTGAGGVASAGIPVGAAYSALAGIAALCLGLRRR